MVKNHKKSILVATAAVGGLIGIQAYMSSFQAQWKQSNSRSFVSEVRKKDTYFDESISIGNSMIGNQYREIVRKFKELFRIEAILEKIKKYQNKVSFNSSLQFLLIYSFLYLKAT